MSLLAFILGWFVELAAALSPAASSGPIGALAYAHALVVHRTTPIADRAVVTLTLPDGASRSERLVLRVYAPSGGMVSIESAALAAWFEAGSGAAVHPGDPTTAVAWSGPDRVDSAAVAARLPALPLPQIALALDDLASPLALTAYTDQVEWEAAVVGRNQGRATVRLIGRTPMGRATLELARGRVCAFSAELPTADGIASLEVTFEPLEPGVPTAWRVDTRGRRLIASLSGLSALGRTLGVGDRMPSVSMYAGAAEVRPAFDAPYTALVFVRDPSDALWGADGQDAAIDAARTGVNGVVEFRRELTRRSIRLPRAGGASGGLRVETFVVVLFEAGAGSVERFVSFQGRWLSVVPDPAEHVLWSPGQRQTLDRIAPSAPGAVVLLGRQRSIVSVVELPSSTEDVARSLIDALGRTSER
ncbi:MAG: hypothetical protein KIS87_01490 [Phycisphaeraceae bacterium]|nr:hypothetical protein [Phycisphaeraceae bacterium]